MGNRRIGDLADRIEGFQCEAYDALGIDGIPGGAEGRRVESEVVGRVAALLERDPVVASSPRAALAAALPVVEDHNAHCAAEALSGFLAAMKDTDGRAG